MTMPLLTCFEQNYLYIPMFFITERRRLIRMRMDRTDDETIFVTIIDTSSWTHK